MKKLIFILMIGLFSFTMVDAQPEAKDDAPTELVAEKQAEETVAISDPVLIEDVETTDQGDSLFDNLPTSFDEIGGLVTGFDALAILLFNLVGYLSFMIPGLRKIKETETRVAAAGLILAGVFITMDVGNAAKLAVEFVISTKVYDYVLKLFKRTPEVEVAKG